MFESKVSNLDIYDISPSDNVILGLAKHVILFGIQGIGILRWLRCGNGPAPVRPPRWRYPAYVIVLVTKQLSNFPPSIISCYVS